MTEEQENFNIGELKPESQLRKEGYTKFGTVVLVVDPRTGKFLWLRSAINKESTKNRIGDWQCLCETGNDGEEPRATAQRGLREELDHRDEVLNNLGELCYLGETPFLPRSGIMARVFISAWHGEPGFTGFSLGEGRRETEKPVWLKAEDSFPGSIRLGVYHGLLNLGEKMSVDHLIEFAQTGDFKKFVGLQERGL